MPQRRVLSEYSGFEPWECRAACVLECVGLTGRTGFRRCNHFGHRSRRPSSCATCMKRSLGHQPSRECSIICPRSATKNPFQHQWCFRSEPVNPIEMWDCPTQLQSFAVHLQGSKAIIPGWRHLLSFGAFACLCSLWSKKDVHSNPRPLLHFQNTSLEIEIRP